MPDNAYSAALAEAYASCPSSVVTLHTMELRHPAFVDDLGVPTAVRVVRNHPDQQTWIDRGGAPVQAVLDAMPEKDRDMVGLVARLEASAPVDGGQMVAWVALAFDFEMPEVSSAPVPELVITMDNVGRELMDKIEAAAESTDKIEVTYRPYLDIDLGGPQTDPPLTMTFVSINCTPTRVVGRARMANIAGKKFPRRTYTARDFPGLAL